MGQRRQGVKRSSLHWHLMTILSQNSMFRFSWLPCNTCNNQPFTCLQQSDEQILFFRRVSLGARRIKRSLILQPYQRISEPSLLHLFPVLAYGHVLTSERIRNGTVANDEKTESATSRTPPIVAYQTVLPLKHVVFASLNDTRFLCSRDVLTSPFVGDDTRV